MRGDVLIAKKVPFALQQNAHNDQWRAIVTPHDRQPTTLPYVADIQAATEAAQEWVKENIGLEFTV